MENLIADDKIPKILFPMIQLLDKKNITEGITIVKENENIYICFDKDCLSDTNQLILEKIARIYSETFFYSDNKELPNSDRLEYWCPDEYYDKKNRITEKCRNKKMCVCELNLNEKFVILGTTIMLANVLQEQDPMCLKINEEKLVLSAEIIKRHEHYISSGYPDLRWIHLSVYLDKNNPLTENPYAPFMCGCEINTPVSCSDIISTTLIGYNKKIYITFSMEKEDIEKAIKEYLKEEPNNTEQNTSFIFDGFSKKILNK